MTPLWIYNNRFVVSHYLTLQWIHWMTLMWLLFVVSTAKSLSPLHCDESLIDVTMNSPSDSQMIMICTFNREDTMMGPLWQITKQLHCEATITVTSAWSLQMTITWESQIYFVITSHGNSSQSNSQYDFTLPSSNGGQLQ